MKTFCALLNVVFLLLLLNPLNAQDDPSGVSLPLQANQVKAYITTGGDLFNKDVESTGFIVPYVPGFPETGTLFTTGLALSGKDEAGNLRVSFVGYRYSDTQTDYLAGPLDDETGFLPMGCSGFNHLWVVNRFEILALIDDYDDNGIIDQPIPENILTWPGRGNAFITAISGAVLPDQDLAPFFDRNNNGIYEPDNGEYPIIGTDMMGVIPDQMIWGVFNDVGNGHIHTPTESLGVEVQLLAYGFNCTDDPTLSRTVFTRHKIIFKGMTPLTDVIPGFWVDPDVGCFTDDFIGTDSTLNTIYFYNEDPVDGENGCLCPSGVHSYCESPPVQSVTILNQPLWKSIAFNGGAIDGPPGVSAPQVPMEYYNYLQGLWRDGTPLTIGGSGYAPGDPNAITTNHIFFDDPNDPDGWSMYTENIPAWDRRSMYSMPPSDKSQGESMTIDMAYTFHQEEGASHLENVLAMQENVAAIQAAYDNGLSLLCSQVVRCESDCVWPGDANNSGRVDKDDVLAVGVGAGHFASGAPRNPAFYNWEPYGADNWNETFINNVNFKHGDCNGDGQLSPEDNSLIRTNYYETKPDFVAPEDIPIEDAPVALRMNHNRDELSASASELMRLLRANIWLGTEEQPVSDLYGLTFTVLYDTSLMASAGVSFPVIHMDFEDFMGDENQTIALSWHHVENGRIDIAISRTDGQEINGFGRLGEIWLQLREDALTGNPDGTREIVYQVVNLKAIDFDENELDIGYRADTTLATDLTFVTSTEEVLWDHQVSIFPNPSRGELTLQMQSGTPSTQFDLAVYSLQGQKLFERRSLEVSAIGQQIQLPEQLGTGVYLLTLTDEAGRKSVQKLMVY